MTSFRRCAFDVSLALLITKQDGFEKLVRLQGGIVSEPNQFEIHREAELIQQIHDCIERKTNGGIRDLKVECLPGAVVVSGRTSRFYFKQLATSAVFDEVPLRAFDLRNAIQVGPQHEAFSS